ncbi:MAG: hypothetical protein A2040_09655 [Rhodocyclales bacterium GWA2_65_19]|nr:MAG: hypothetical protein A2040_09655 [Rhodocyclales bacterium GWA2_65_19]
MKNSLICSACARWASTSASEIEARWRGFVSVIRIFAAQDSFESFDVDSIPGPVGDALHCQHQIDIEGGAQKTMQTTANPPTGT